LGETDRKPPELEDLADLTAEDFDELWQPDRAGGPKGPERVLLERGQVSAEALDEARRMRKEFPHLTVLEILVRNGMAPEMEALEALAEYFQLPFERIAPGSVERNTFDLLSEEYIKEKKVIPLRQEEEAVVLGLTDPADIFVIDDARRRLRRKTRLVVVPASDIETILEEFSAGPVQQVDDIIQDIADDAVEVVDEQDEEVTDLEKIAGESPVIRYVNYLISSAVRDGASDIHIEPGENRLRVRCRIDGILFDQKAPPLQMHAAIISRLKIMANLDIAERRLPQDGRIRVTVHGRTVDLRVSTLPVTTGEKCVIRILDNRSISVGLEKLGFLPDVLERFRRQVLEPHGIVLVTGPTGSGKSTTLYSALQIMDGDALNISTVEDPVEYELAFANQVNVRDSIGMSFSAALRSLLRQDPDVIMVGEIRDAETARIAVQASLTGHMVLSTLHTNDSPSSITRLINIGIEPYLIAASVNAVLAQRLVRRICENCKEPARDLPAAQRAFLESRQVSPEEVYRGAGCEKCRNTGFKGRQGLYEFMEMDDELRDMVTSNPMLTELRRKARSMGMRCLVEDGLEKVKAGLTAVEEIMRVTGT
jgi:type IV pilus assembly protein PilB